MLQEDQLLPFSIFASQFYSQRMCYFCNSKIKPNRNVFLKNPRPSNTLIVQINACSVWWSLRYSDYMFYVEFYYTDKIFLNGSCSLKIQ